ncbi:MAG: hypothetical protein ACOC7V_16880, partial [Spirochaetota bacterium]
LRIPRSLNEFRHQRVTLHIRPEDVDVVSPEDEPATSLRVIHVLPEGGHSYVHFHLGGPYKPLVARTSPLAVRKSAIDEQRHVRLTRGTVYSPDSGYLIGEFAE